MHEKNGWIRTAIVAAMLLGGASVAQAQYAQPGYGPPPGYYPPPAGYYRNGLVAGLAIGFGALDASGCDSTCGAGLSLEGNIGGMINPRMAVLFDAWTTIHPIPNTDGDTTNSIFAGALKYWATPIFWLEGGAGLGHTTVSSASAGTLGDSTAFALMGALGIELVQSGPFALDLQGRIARTFHSDADGGAINNFAFLVGFNWY
jgi:hypothetical protein